MDKVRALKWGYNPIAFEWYAETKFVTYKAYDDGYWYTDGLDDGHLADADAAMDACEKDYIARCSEFLRVAGPGECVVKVDQLIEVVAAACKTCNKAGICPGVHMLPMTCCVCASLTAAIDAAGGGK